ncbi:HTH-type transcriptional activator RhaR [Paenibacillus auburnensis]|uniref:HTH-type transcriptional activator RhaR n=1 Tax=Paenibacillus auburnensis TaxID=2905649 RepID=A0ABM9CAP7_9BACL|nr:helix-turn-helix domain-containing protein [Paenibacillus auburnensis]CAH1207622.1 HTH-type transcriptional activator RhaR [Paenibacillus auburnensis]
MDHAELEHFLRRHNAIEVKQRLTRRNIEEFGGKELALPEGERVPRLPEHFFFSQGDYHISKHHRYAAMPEHTHAFIELNYMYSGRCRQTIGGSRVELTQGQICLLDTDVPHSISSLDEDDILINILMRKETLNAAFLTRLGIDGRLSDFLVNAQSPSAAHNRYLVFRSENCLNLHHTLASLMCEYYDPRDFSADMIGGYMVIVFTELMRVLKQDSAINGLPYTNRADLLGILQYLECNFQDCSLKELAAHFNFNPNYLGNLLKKSTGKTFGELVQEYRMAYAALLLTSSDRPIGEIAGECGYESLSFFHKKFAERYGLTPLLYRKKNKTT